MGRSGLRAQMWDEYSVNEIDLPSFAMVSQAGCFVNAVICIQQLFRHRRSFRTLVGARLLPIQLRRMAIQHTVARFLEGLPRHVAPKIHCVCGGCDLAWFEKGWQCPAMRKSFWPPAMRMLAHHRGFQRGEEDMPWWVSQALKTYHGGHLPSV